MERVPRVTPEAVRHDIRAGPAALLRPRARARPGRREARERELLSAYGQLGDANEVLNERAVAVMKRMSDKLTGRDFLQARHPRRAVPARFRHVLCARLW